MFLFFVFFLNLCVYKGHYRHHADIMASTIAPFLRWELLDNPSQSSLCSCCDSTCKSRFRRGVDWGITFLQTWMSFYFKMCAFFFLHEVIKIHFSSCQNPTASVTNLCWDPWSSWIRLTRRLTTYRRCLFLELSIRCNDKSLSLRSLSWNWMWG